ncbi:helix-turn-helix domain-containing protein [Sporomusa sphaeroides]|uniref:Helix-turn-helix domain protein n=1 Tax=Sporomusa sphaeroides DSM 2875 TaxID=1337886 RepID=A0ABM9W378_9FIRM|nr:helix-turn-helix domain-containing protein [Sporomusa sphaeroides]OLS56814.1 helix-turn-helix domain protein [Sporomusa sphaeroides DSM 2875]CVK18761.1 Helix-turn-helix domain protein [Sporomusa sphaeroides DSM 2875]
MKTAERQIFTLKDANGKQQLYTVNESGQLVPYIEKKANPNEKPWAVSNGVADTCKILGLSRGTVMKLISSGQLRAIKAGAKRWIIPGSSIEQFLAQ